MQPIDRAIASAARLSLAPRKAECEEAIRQLEAMRQRSDLEWPSRFDLLISLAKAYQRVGRHRDALAITDQLWDATELRNDRFRCVVVASVSGPSLSVLHCHEPACQTLKAAIEEAEVLKMDRRIRAGLALEAGKAFRAAGDTDSARVFWTQAVEMYEELKDVEHAARARSNLGITFLTDPDEALQEQGVRILEEAIAVKERIDDVPGLAVNYNNLARHFVRKKRYERAIALYRKDLQLSRRSGDQRGVAVSHTHLVVLYTEMHQMGPAREALRAVNLIAEELNDPSLRQLHGYYTRWVNAKGRELGMSGKPIGPRAPCTCERGKAYADCCGKADFEPVDYPIRFGGVGAIAEDIPLAGGGDADRRRFRLDTVLRTGNGAEQRFSWTRIEPRDGWMKVEEIPDLANVQLLSARALADEASAEADSLSKPIACVILSVCALEAFINQVAFFARESADLGDDRFALPEALKTDVLEYQRHTRLEEKWSVLGELLGGTGWKGQGTVWNDFLDLVRVRNELVHYKVEAYYSISPPPKVQEPVMGWIPEEVERRDVPHSWPVRVLTPGYARWCVDVAEGMIRQFRGSYEQAVGAGSRAM